ncbi:DUF4857 domain-containing protein [Desulfobotulus sp. H1]|uniref:DUF4857 domain-containing protein n=1 Tax=Desulfobotulus pelophilus TaxID=2823377 RepID=A0ABT3N9Y9_9BACT|nr:DUF4857 domain-containing protein [Desulfobotulus pelophilus]MCW7753782.1 DUF4857 domain-containing protein [Desulfobotulus pelophilus]
MTLETTLQTLSRWVLCLSALLVMASVLPRMFDLAFRQATPVPFVLFSPVDNLFFMSGTLADGQRIYRDETGREYDRKTFMAKTPLFWFRDVFAWGMMPRLIEDVPITRKTVEEGSQIFRYRPGDLPSVSIPLWPLLESASDFSNLRLPETMFWNDGALVFENGITRKRDESMTRKVGQSLSDAGFSFPVQAVWGNPTTRKSHDDGYFLKDGKGRLFHLQQIKGEPVCLDTGVSGIGAIRYLVVSEDERRELYGYFITDDGRFHLLMQEDYRVISPDLMSFDPETMGLLFMADMLGRTVVYGNAEQWYALRLSLDYDILHSYGEKVAPALSPSIRFFKTTLFPFIFQTKAEYGKGAALSIQFSGLAAMYGTLFFSSLFLAIRKRVTGSFRVRLYEAVLLLSCGLYGFVVLFMEKSSSVIPAPAKKEPEF